MQIRTSERTISQLPSLLQHAVPAACVHLTVIYQVWVSRLLNNSSYFWVWTDQKTEAYSYEANGGEKWIEDEYATPAP